MKKWAKISLEIVPWVIIILFTYWYIYLGWLNEMHLRNGLDLGTYTQILHNLSQGNAFPPFNTLKGGIAWGDHAHFIMILFAPIFRLFPSHMTVLVIQTLVMTTSGWAIYKIAQGAVKNYLFSGAMLVAYLLFFGVQYALDFDFHPSVLTAALLAWSFYALHFKKWKLYWLFLGLNLLTREDAATFYVMLGAWLVIFQPHLPFFIMKNGWRWHKEKTIGVITIVVALVYFSVVSYGLMPMWRVDGAALSYFDIPDSAETPVEIIDWVAANPLTIGQNMFDTSIKVRTIKSLFENFAWLPLLSPFTYLMIIPNFLARFLSLEEQRHMMKLHYSASLVSVLAYGAILGMANLETLRKKMFPKVSIVSLLAIAVAYGAYTTSWDDSDLPLHKISNPNYASERAIPWSLTRGLSIVAHMVGQEDSVSATSSLVPALGRREKIFAYPAPFPEKEPLWVVLTHEGSTWPLPKGEMQAAIKEFRKNDKYEVMFDDFGIVAFRRNR